MVSTEIRLIRNKHELQGTCYFEFLPGPYAGNCWNKSSVYLDEETFGFLEPTLVRHARSIDRFSFAVVPSKQWGPIADDLDSLAEFLAKVDSMDAVRDRLGWFFTDSESKFAEHFSANARALATVSRELAVWTRGQLQDHDSISVLGI